MKKALLLLCVMITTTYALFAQNSIMHWDFEKNINRKTIEPAKFVADTLEGLYSEISGIKGKGILLDGFTTRIVRDAEDVQVPSSELTIGAWIALGNYPWNWCPIITTESNEIKGYRLMVGPLGQVSMQVAIGEQWIVCTTKEETIPLRKWMYVTGTYSADNKLEIYVNGELLNTTPIRGKVLYTKADCVLGMTSTKDKPSDLHRTWGTQAQYFGLDGIIDEIKVYDKVLDVNKIKDYYSSISVPLPDINPRHLPIAKSTGVFKAYYTKLKYYPGWDNVWRVGDDPDIVVCFKDKPIKLIFWRGIRYGASWVSENENWMSDQSVEAWGIGDQDKEGCFEHMQDRHCRFSHVRIIENTPGRVVIHWRYAPVSSNDNLWKQDEKTGWECWVDEYYYVYPDGSAIRKVSWDKGSLGPVRQFQETLALLSPGQTVSELMEKECTTVSDYQGRRGIQKFTENPQIVDTFSRYTIQRYNYKSINKPYICFEPGNVMTLRNGHISTYNKAVGCNHFPVGQARCDGRTTRMSDRPSHCTSFPISDPVVHEGDKRNYWCALYGMSDMSMDEIQAFGCSWAYAPDLKTFSDKIVSEGYDRSERCYMINNKNAKNNKIQIRLNGSSNTPIINPAFYIKNWDGSEEVSVIINGKKYDRSTSGVYHKIDGNNLIVFLFINKTEPLDIIIQSK